MKELRALWWACYKMPTKRCFADASGYYTGVASRPCGIEMLESKEQWAHRLKFTAVPITQDVVTELRDLITHHASGWGLISNEEDHTQLLSWKGHGLTFESAWVSTYPWIRLLLTEIVKNPSEVTKTVGSISGGSCHLSSCVIRMSILHTTPILL